VELGDTRHIDGSRGAEDVRDAADDVGVGGVPVYERILPALPASITRMRGELGEALAPHGLAPARRDAILLVMTEAATNAVLHAYRDADPGPLYVAATLVGRAVVVSVTDRGSGMCPRSDSPGLGLGLRLMRELADELRITADTSGAGTCVQATFADATAAIADTRSLRPTPVAEHGGILRDYLQALSVEHTSLCQDTQALLAEAEQAVRHARRQQRDRARRR
jgi:serine/threonine-protein kinase RsbW/stage II sporulation protein AB (anti-sigma F factor)